MRVLEQVWLPSEILPVVSIHALRLVVVFGERTPGCLEVKQVEVYILGAHQMQQWHLDVLLRMSKAAEIIVLTLPQSLGVVRAEFRLILVRMVEPLHSVVRELALVSTAQLLFRSLAHLVRVLVLRGRPSLVLVRVEIRTVFVIVLVGQRTRLRFKELQIQMDRVFSLGRHVPDWRRLHEERLGGALELSRAGRLEVVPRDRRVGRRAVKFLRLF